MCSLLSKLVAVIAVAVIVVAVIAVAVVVAKGMANDDIVYLQHVLSSVKTCRCHRCRCHRCRSHRCRCCCCKRDGE